MIRPRQLSLTEATAGEETAGVTAPFAEVPAGVGTDYGEVFTRRWIVELILDLVGYTPQRDLGAQLLVEPSCGSGAFLVPIVDRLVASALSHGRPLDSLAGAVRAFDLLEGNADLARKAVRVRLEEAGLDPDNALRTATSWVTAGDFLLAEHRPASADFVVGNPPYVRLESVPREVMDTYRRSCATMRGRSDIYVGFVERGLELLRPGGVLGYICADRWMRNSYGAELRQLITSAYGVDAVISMHDVDAFEDEVSAYPAVVVVRNAAQGRAAVAETNRSFAEADATRLVAWARGTSRAPLHEAGFTASKLDGWFDGRDMWPCGTPAQLAVIADLEARFPPLQDALTGTRVGIGVATGCDDVYLTTDRALVEEDRLLPLLKAGDTVTGAPRWSGTYLVNPWDDDGLVSFDAYPRLGRYLESHSLVLRGRHVARRRPSQWYRTIDRVDPVLRAESKLVFPDLKASSHPVLDDGRFYPHHNLYFVVSSGWDLEVLGGLLLSDVANLFVGAYCVKMRGGCFRFQAQYLRRIRVPEVSSLGKRNERRLAEAFRGRDSEAANAAARRVYGLSELPVPAGRLI